MLEDYKERRLIHARRYGGGIQMLKNAIDENKTLLWKL